MMMIMMVLAQRLVSDASVLLSSALGGDGRGDGDGGGGGGGGMC